MEHFLVRAARIVELDVLELDLALHIVRLGIWRIKLDLRHAVNHIKCLLAGSSGSSVATNVWSDATESHHSKEDSKEDGDDVASLVWPIKSMIVELLVNPDGPNSERISVSKVDCEEKEAELEGRFCSGCRGLRVK